MEESKTNAKKEDTQKAQELELSELGPLEVDPAVAAVHLERIRFRAWEDGGF